LKIFATEICYVRSAAPSYEYINPFSVVGFNSLNSWKQ